MAEIPKLPWLHRYYATDAVKCFGVEIERSPTTSQDEWLVHAKTSDGAAMPSIRVPHKKDTTLAAYQLATAVLARDGYMVPLELVEIINAHGFAPAPKGEEVSTTPKALLRQKLRELKKRRKECLKITRETQRDIERLDIRLEKLQREEDNRLGLVTENINACGELSVLDQWIADLEKQVKP